MTIFQIVLVVVITLLVEHAGAWLYIWARHWLRNPKRESFEEEDGWNG